MLSIAVLGVLALIGLIVLPILLAAVLIGAIYLGVKLWRFKRQVEQMLSQPSPDAPDPNRENIDADYIDRD